MRPMLSSVSPLVVRVLENASLIVPSLSLPDKTIREEFDGSTIITIAHRIRTVVDFDKILVMDSGSLVEYASPYELLQNPKSAVSLRLDLLLFLELN